MQEVRENSDPSRVLDSRGKNMGTSASLVGMWWAAWIITNITGQISLRFGLRAESIDELLNSTWLTMGATVAALLAAVFAILVVKSVTSDQDECQRLMELAKRQQPTPSQPPTA